MQASGILPSQNQQGASSALASAQPGVPSTGEAGNLGNAESEALNGVDFQNFLTLLTAQLKNQDPLDPANSTEFVAQLAQFSSVEQLVVANDKLDAISSSLVADGIDKYASWIGKGAEATGAATYFNGVDPVEFRLTGDAQAARVEAVITDQSGQEVARFAAQNGGQVQSWNGQVNGAPAPVGAYAVTANYYDSEGNLMAEEIANTFGGVREVRLAGDEPAIILEGGIEIAASQVVGLGVQDDEV